MQNLAPTDQPLLRAENLQGDWFGPVSLRLYEGERVFVQGPSGAGKSLLLRALADMDPVRGEIWLDGAARSALMAPHWRRQVGLLPAESHWWAETVREHMATDAVNDLAALGFGADVLNWQVSRLSSGERQRLALVRLLSNRPRVLLLDEPTANLDENNTAKVETLVTHYTQERRAGLLWVSHDPDQAGRLGSSVVRMAEGRLQT